MLIWYGSAPAHGRLRDGEGCYCHNNGIGININGTDWGHGSGISSINIEAGGSSHLHVSTNNVNAIGVVPVQEWMSNQSDNAKFIFSPQIVYDNSPQDLSEKTGTITALYTITAPLTLQSGVYGVTLFAQGTYLSIWAYVSATPIPEFDGATLILTISAFVIITALVMMRARKRFP